MLYNTEYLDLHYTLINAFLIKADKYLLDVSYIILDNVLTIQVVMLEGTVLPEVIKQDVKNKLPSFVVNINVLYISKEQFNEIESQWLPVHYNWLDYVLFSKAEMLW